MQDIWKYKNVEALIQKNLISTPIGKLFDELNRECGSCYATITLKSPDLVLKAHDDKGVPLIEIGKNDDPSSLSFLSDVYRDLSSAPVRQRVIDISDQLNFFVKNYRLICDFIEKSK